MTIHIYGLIGHDILTMDAMLLPGLFPAWILILVVSSGSTDTAEEAEILYQPSCRRPLGMETGDIPDSSITASSSFDEKSVGPLNARIRTERNGGAWCPQSQISKDVYEYLQVDLGRVKVITLVETQGRFGNGQGMEFAPQYVLEYQRQDGDPWRHYHNHHGEEIVQGNSNTYLAEKRELHPPIIARRVRFIPHSVHRRTICMRVELHGCRGQGILSYSMSQGESRGSEVDLYDLTYDGTEMNHYLSGGLGQLVDGDLGTWNFRLDLEQTGHKGYQWIGWRNDSLNADPIDIIFSFDELRNMSGVTIHSNNLFNKDIRVFRRAEIYASIGGLYFDNQPVVYDYYRDDVMYHARNVTIPIPHLVAKYVKLRLHFDSRWMLISEIIFQSDPANQNMTLDVPPPHPPPPPPPPRIFTTYPRTPPTSKPVTTSHHKPLTTEPIAIVIPGDYDEGLPRLPDVPLSAGDEDSLPEVDIWPIHESTTTGGLSTPLLDVNPDKPHNHGNVMDDTYIGIIIGTLTALILLMAGLVIFCVMRRRKKYPHASMKTLTPDDLTYGIPPGKHVNGNVYNAVATTEGGDEKHVANGHVHHRVAPQMLTNGDLSLINKPRDLGSNPDLSPSKSLEAADNEENLSRDYVSPDISHDYGSPDVTQVSPLVVTLPPSPMYHSAAITPDSARSLPEDDLHTPDDLQTPPTPPPPPHTRALPPATDQKNIKGWSGNSKYAVTNADAIWQEQLNILEFPRQVLKFVEKLGQGQFGEVHLCEAEHAADFLSDDFLYFEPRSRSLLVAVKMLRPDVNGLARCDFHQEVKILSRLKDPNIVRVLGVCSQGEPLAVVMEYLKYGDLHQFLLDHIPDSTLNQHKQANLLSYGCLIYMATQIASGMKYLETLNMVHRDLATRNCLVGHLYTIKISDFGMSRGLYKDDYYSIDGKAVLPVRWMAWESVLLGKFSCKSDVWSFAVTLWEVLTFARDRPYGNYGNEQVLENCGHYYRGDGQHTALPQPPNCPKEIYDLMVECCHRDESLRPTFREIHMFLSRKNMGYDPRSEQPMRFALGYDI